MGQIWRLILCPGGGTGTPAEAASLCKDESVLGMGWGVNVATGVSLPWADYLDLAEARHRPKPGAKRKTDPLGNVRRWYRDVAKDDLVWTRNTRAEYLLARVIGEWCYKSEKEFVKQDIVNVRAVEFVEVGNESNVPGKIVRQFRGQTLTRIKGVTNLSRRMWNERSPSDSFKYPYSKEEKTDLFDILSPQDVEDIVFIMLQWEDLICLPTRRRADTMAYEYLLRSRDGRRSVAVQVKTGRATAASRQIPSDVDEIVLFSTDECYDTSDPRGIPTRKLSRSQVLSFIRHHLHVLPRAVVSAYELWQSLTVREK